MSGAEAVEESNFFDSEKVDFWPQVNFTVTSIVWIFWSRSIFLILLSYKYLNILITFYVTGIAEETLYDWMKRQQSEKHLLENGEVIVDPDNDEIVTIKIKVIETKH